MHKPKILLSVLLGLPLVLLSVSVCAQASVWEEISHEDGIKVWQRSVPGKSLVEFRGRGLVGASYAMILAVLQDSTRKTEWMDSCVDARMLRTIGPGNSIMYNRTGSTVPLIDDRDVVLETSVDIRPEKRRIKIDVWSVADPKMPEVDGVVRMPELRATWILDALGPKKTRVTYTVQADPGGALPHWLVNMVAKRLPARTLQKLRKQTQKSGYEDRVIKIKNSFDWSAFNWKPTAPAHPVPPPMMRKANPAATRVEG